MRIVRVGKTLLLFGATAAIAACSGSSKPVSLSTLPAGTGGGSTTTTIEAPVTTPTTAAVSLAPTTVTTVATGLTTTSGPPTTTPSGPTATAAGTYLFNATGKYTFTEGIFSTTAAASGYELTVSTPVDGIETWTDPNNTTKYLFNGTGVFLESKSISALKLDCTFGSAMPSPPWPVTVGAPFSGQADCGGGKTLSVSGEVTATSSVGGVATFTIGSTSTLSGTNLLITETDWYAPSLGLAVKSTMTVSGSANGYSLHSNETYTLASL